MKLSQKLRFPTAGIVGISLLIICIISLYIRIALPYEQVFVNGTVWFKGTDAWYHMRLVDNLLHHFPHRISFDPYICYPYGAMVSWPPFFDWFIASLSWLIGLGSPSQHTIDIVGAYTPSILGTMTIIPVYFIGKELFNRWVGTIAAALIAILPGEFLNRSLLGFTDHHVAESLLTTVSMLFLILAYKKARERNLSFNHLLNKNWAVITKPLLYTSLAGIFLGIYLLTWIGGLLFVFTISACLLLQFIVDHLRHKSTDYLCIIGSSFFLIAFIISSPYLSKDGLNTSNNIPLFIAIAAPLILSSIANFMSNRTIKPVYYVPTIFGLAGISLAIFHAINPSLLHSMLSKFGIFAPSGASLTILEAHPLLFPFGHFTLQIAWLNFTTAFFISFISLGCLIHHDIKAESADKTFFLIWSIIMLLAVLGQRRFSYYYAINASLLTGYFSWRILESAGLQKLLTKPKQTLGSHIIKKKRREKKKIQTRQKSFLHPRVTWIKVIGAGVAIFFLIIFPNIGLPGIKPHTKVCGLPIKLTQPIALQQNIIDESWYSSLLWLKENTPEPFQNPNSYYELYKAPLPGEHYKYPESAYAVMSWWDYSHWIIRISHRIPNSSAAGQINAAEAGRFFTAQNETSANQIADKMRSQYIIIDHAMPTTKFYAMPRWAGSSEDEFFGTYYRQNEAGKLESVTLFYPAYYRSTVTRLYNFDGQAVEPKNSTLVVFYKEHLVQEGVSYREIVSSSFFPSYKEAEIYISKQESGNYRIVGTDQFISPVPLEKMMHYKLVYASPQKWHGKAAVKIFEYSQ